MKNFFLILFAAFISLTGIQAKELVLKQHTKCNPELSEFLQVYHKKGISEAVKMQSLSAPPEQYQNINTVLYCNDEATTVEKLEKMGIQVEIISPSAITAFLPVNKIEAIAAFPSVNRLVGLDKKQLHLNNARIYSGVLNAHKGKNLDTPYTGKGVIVGLIDQGIQYDHAAFRATEDSTRIFAALNLTKATPVFYKNQQEVLMAADDGMDEAHGTHVAGIIAGGQTLGSKNYYGMAPDAQIFAVSSSTLSDADILTAVKRTKELAEKEGKPWVFNMSLGSNLHFHNGMDDLSLQLDTIVMNGGHIVASAGNDGGYTIHAEHTFAAANESKYLLIDNNKSKQCYVMGAITFQQQLSGILDCGLYIYDTNTGQLTEVNDSVNWGSGYVTIDNTNKYCYLQLSIHANKILDDYTSTNQKIAVKIISKESGQKIDLWGQDGYGTFEAGGANFITPDSKNIISSPSIAEKVISVGSYTTATGWTKMNSTSGYTIQGAVQGNRSSFSSVGPTLRKDLLKPDICAPGQVIISSVKNCSEYASGTNGSNYLVEQVNIGTSPFYYAAMQGTSMAAPATTGIIALWLQAKPDLTHEQIMEVLKETSTAFTGQTKGEWDYQYGYGKIQAYLGLKKVLTFPTAINTVRNTETPVTFWKGNSEWKILFNSGENFASIQLCSLDGRIIKNVSLNNISRGQEETLSLGGLTKGIYIIRIQTQNSNISRKVLVE